MRGRGVLEVHVLAIDGTVGVLEDTWTCADLALVRQSQCFPFPP
jgi:hypothetical protein